MNEMTIARFLERYRAEFLEDMEHLIRIPSVSKQDENGEYPFGKECARVLDTALTKGKELGFETENHDYYCGSILMPGTGTGEIGMFAHLDVVPEGDGWLHDPYDPYIKDGWLYGRGSADNKGAAVTALYAMRYLKENGIRLRHRVRLFLGCSEENGMKDIEYYLSHFSAPDFSFTPDASFSVCYSEKGILEGDFEIPLPTGIVSFTSGVASNSVSANACALIENPSQELPEVDSGRWPEISVCQDGNRLKIEAAGRSAHAAFPEGSVNAGAVLAAFLCESGLIDKEATAALSFPAECFKQHYGEGLGIECDGGNLGKLTAICGMIRTENKRLKLNINIRYPAQVHSEEMIEKITEKAAEYGWLVKAMRDDPPSYIDPEEPVIKALNDICQKQLSASFEPYCMGGGTYARKLPKAVAFGPGIRGQKKPEPEGHGGGHQPDECVKLEILENALAIYIEALQKIDELIP